MNAWYPFSSCCDTFGYNSCTLPLAQAAGLLRRLNATTADLNTTTADLEGTRSELEATRSDLKATQSDLEATRSDLEVAASQLASTAADLAAVREKLEDAQLEGTDLNGQATSLRAQVAELQEHLGTKSEQVRHICGSEPQGFKAGAGRATGMPELKMRMHSHQLSFFSKSNCCMVSHLQRWKCFTSHVRETLCKLQKKGLCTVSVTFIGTAVDSEQTKSAASHLNFWHFSNVVGNVDSSEQNSLLSDLSTPIRCQRPGSDRLDRQVSVPDNSCIPCRDRLITHPPSYN
eukprot:1110832-Pelagomonas_calceolata.AAC.4